MNKVIGVLLEDEAKQGLKQDFFSAVIEGFRQYAAKKGYTIMMFNNYYGDRPTYTEQVKLYDMDGVFVTTATYNDELWDLLKVDVPVGTIDYDAENTVNVMSNNTRGMNELMEYIISMGHRKIGYIMGDGNYVSNTRLNEFLKVLEKHHINLPEEYLIHSHFRDVERAAYYTEKLLKLPDPPTCIVYSDDYAAMGGVNVINARGLEIPRDISIAGYDGNELLANIEPALTTVAQNNMLMGETAAKRLIYNIEHPDDPVYGDTIIDSEFTYGRSVGRVYSAF